MRIPTGTVTFLFTDIEASTRLAREHSEKWETVRSRHHKILREAIEGCHGYVFQVIGDAFCASFHTAADALKAAVRAQQRLQREPWGETVVRVRMGIHTGEAEAKGKDYRGYLTMSLVQRLMSAGHGGQVLVSGVTENLLRGHLPEDFQLQDMGRHHFKDVPQVVRVFQVIAPNIQAEFPPLLTLDLHPNNLPTQLTSFVGREKELVDVKRLLQNTHMLTLIGPGGTGKTRLSVRAASEIMDSYPDGVWLVELAPILDPTLVPRATAIAIGLRDEPQRPVIDMLCDYLHEKKMLILLDNCEHLVDACARLADRILHAAPGVVILASSREALGIGGEVTYRVPSLELPDLSHLPPLEALNQYEAVRLFIDRAGSADSAFTVTNDNAPAVAQICHRLDGIPLAIELAAAKIRVLDVDQIARRLEDRFKLLTGGSRTALERHQTLRAAIDWSYNLLPRSEQVLFQRLSIFVGGWTLEGAEAVCSDETVKLDDVLELLEQLIHKSVVFRDESRYRMLETLRQYANEKLVESGQRDSLQDRHLDYFLELAETAAPHLIRSEQREWLAKLDIDYENLRAAFEWALGREEAEHSLRLCAALSEFWIMRGYWMEGTQFLAKALAKPVHEDNHKERTARVEALYWDAALADDMDDLERMGNSAKLSLALAEQGANELDTAIARYYVGFSLYRRGGSGEARPLMEQSLRDFEKLDHTYWEAFAYSWLSYILVREGELKQSEAYSRRLELARKSGERWILADALISQASLYYIHEEIEEASQVLEQADTLYNQMGQVVTMTGPLFAVIAWLRGDTRQARAILMEQQERLRVLGEKNNRAGLLLSLGALAMEEGDLDQAQVYLNEALVIRQEIADKIDMVFCLAELSLHANLQGNSEKFKQTLKECISMAMGISQFQKIRIVTRLISCPYFQTPENSVPFLGAIDFHYAQQERTINPLEKRYYDRAEAKARATLGDAVFETAFAEGAKMSIDEALELMLKSVEEI